MDLTSKAKINKWDSIKLKGFFTARKTINRVKRHPVGQEKLFASHISDTELISKIHKEHIQHNSKKEKKKKKKIGKGPKETSF